MIVLSIEDNDRSKIYVGPPEKRQETISADCLSEIKDLIKNLTSSDKNKLKEML